MVPRRRTPNILHHRSSILVSLSAFDSPQLAVQRTIPGTLSICHSRMLLSLDFPRDGEVEPLGIQARPEPDLLFSF